MKLKINRYVDDKKTPFLKKNANLEMFFDNV